MPAKAVSYIRFRSAKQADGDSLRRQRAARDDYYKRTSLVLDESLSLSDLGVSTWKGDNADTGGSAVFLDRCHFSDGGHRMDCRVDSSGP